LECFGWLHMFCFPGGVWVTPVVTS
jgi:hypothetical protein